MATSNLDLNALSEERVLWDRLVKSDGWKLFTANRKRSIEPKERSLRAPSCENRDWTAGYVSAVLDLLTFPDERIVTLDKKLNDASR